MTVEKLERVMWRLRKRHPAKDDVVTHTVTNDELARAIMYECGTDPATISKNRSALKKLGWISIYNKSRVRLTNADLVGD